MLIDNVDVTEKQMKIIRSAMVRTFKNCADYYVRIGALEDAQLMARIGKALRIGFKAGALLGSDFEVTQS
jgi:hypothetical protein